MKPHNSRQPVRSCPHNCLHKTISSALDRWQESVRARLGLMVKRIILRKYKYPSDQQDAAVELILQQAEELLGEGWG